MIGGSKARIGEAIGRLSEADADRLEFQATGQISRQADPDYTRYYKFRSILSAGIRRSYTELTMALMLWYICKVP